ncbi:MAG TPA: hypothetical protein ENK31_07230, partial [Nannocystis exedens]|nr:hypothetical protein [Nannocystis exedens]
MHDARSALRRHRPTIASLGLVALSATLAYHHSPDDHGQTSDSIESPTLAMATSLGEDVTGALILDLVEPEDGEGGSEAELDALIQGLGL